MCLENSSPFDTSLFWLVNSFKDFYMVKIERIISSFLIDNICISDKIYLISDFPLVSMCVQAPVTIEGTS